MILCTRRRTRLADWLRSGAVTFHQSATFYISDTSNEAAREGRRRSSQCVVAVTNNTTGTSPPTTYNARTISPPNEPKCRAMIHVSSTCAAVGVLAGTMADVTLPDCRLIHACHDPALGRISVPVRNHTLIGSSIGPGTYMLLARAPGVKRAASAAASLRLNGNETCLSPNPTSAHRTITAVAEQIRIEVPKINTPKKVT